MFGFVIVTVLTADTDPTCTLPNASESGEKVGFARIPEPSSVTDCGLFAASSVIIKFPLSAPVWVGLNTALTAQLAPGGSSSPLHVSLAIVNSPDATTLAIWKVAAVGFSTVVIFAALVAPTSTLPKLDVSGLIVSLPAIPVPLNAAEQALRFASSLTASVALRAPSAVGVNVTLSVQLLPFESVAPQVLSEI